MTKGFVNVLSRVCLGYVTSEDITLLEKRKISLHSDTLSGRMKELVQISIPCQTILCVCYPLGTCVLS